MGKVLVVDDDPSIITLLQRVIQKKGHQIIIARNGREGLMQAQAELPDLILTDIRMPDMEGGELAATLKADKRLARIPVIIMSGSDQAISGAATVLTKPFDIRDIYAMLEHYLTATPSNDTSSQGQ